MPVYYNADIYFADGGNAGDTYVTGGTFSIGGTYTIGGSLYLQTGGRVLVNSVNGHIVLQSDLHVALDAGGALRLANGGQITVPGAVFVANSGRIDIGGGAVDAATTAGKLNASQLNFGPGAALVRFNHTDTDYVFGAAMSGTGSLVQAAGVTRLTGDSSGFTGSADVTGGTLLVDGSMASTSVVVRSGGTLGGQGGSTGAVTVENGGTLTQTQGSTLSMTDLSLSEDSNVDVTLGAPDSTTPLFAVSGALQLDGKLNVSSNGSFDLGSYALFSYGSVNDLGLTLATLPPSFNPGDWAIAVANGTVSLVVAAGAGRQYWDGAGTTADNAVGGGSGVWAAGTTNWTNASGSINAPWAGEGAVFGGAAGGTVTVDGTQNVTSLLFSTDGYQLAAGTGAGLALVSATDAALNTAAGVQAGIGVALTGSVGVVKLGTGTLTLSANNGYTGLTTVQAGTLALSGSGSVAASSGVSIAAGATFDISAVAAAAHIATLGGAGNVQLGARQLEVEASTGTYTGTLAGTGTLVKQGSGTFTFAGTANNLAAVQVQAGTLATSGGNAIGNDTAVSVAAGATLAITGAEAMGSLSGAGNVTLTGGLLTGRSDSTFSGSISGGNGTLVKVGTGTLTLAGNNSYGGSVPAGGTATTVEAGTLRIDGGSLTHANATVQVGSLSTAARLEIFNGSVTDRTGSVGNTSGAAQAVVGTGGTWTNTNDLRVGATTGSNGTLRIENGGDVSSTAGVVGGNNGTASVTVTGAGSTWIDTGLMTVGGTSGSGTASLTVANGGRVVADAEQLGTTMLVRQNGTVNIGAAAGQTAVAAGELDVMQLGLTNNGVLNFNHSSSIEFASEIDVGTSARIEVNAGTTVLSGALTGPGSFSGGGTINVRGGTLALTADNYFFTGSTVLHGGTLVLGHNYALGTGPLYENPSLTVAGAGTLSLAEGLSVMARVTLNAALDVEVGTAELASLAGPIGGTGSLVKVGEGTLVLSYSSNSYTGGNAVEAGTLIGNTATIRGDSVLSAGAILAFNQATDGTYAGAISGTGTVDRVGVGTLTLSGNSTFEGQLRINTGTVELSSATAAGASTIVFSSYSASTLRLHGSVANTLSDFGADDRIDLQDLAFAGGPIDVERTGGTFTIERGGQIVTLNFSGLDADYGLLAEADSDGSTVLRAVARNDAPVLDLNSAAAGTGVARSYTEQAAAVALAPAATLADSDSADFLGGQLTVAFSANGTTDDLLAIRNDGTGAGQIGLAGGNVTFAGTVIGTWSGGTAGTDLVIDFTSASATPAAVQALLRAITFANGSDTPSTATRSIGFSLVDGDGTAAGGTDTATATATVTVTASNDDATGVPVVTGTARQGQTLQADTGGIDDADGLGTLQYQWLRDGDEIDGAQADSYTLVEDDVGHAISLRVSFEDLQGNDESVTSLPTAAVENLNDDPVGRPAIGGTAQQRAVLTADTSGIADDDGLGTFSYRWLRDGDATGATGTSYTLTQVDVGAQISLEVSYTDGHGTLETVTSLPTAEVANVNDDPTGALSIVGSAQPGQLLSAVSTIADADGLGPFSYVWLRNGVAIPGAQSATYVVQPADNGQAIRVEVTYEDGYGALERVASAAVVPGVDAGPETGVKITAPAGGGTVVGTALDDTLLGQGGRDVFHPRAGTDHVDGRGNIDTVVFEGVRSDYTVQRTGSDSFVVTSWKGDTTVLLDIERLAFGDGLTLAMDLTPAQAQIARLYSAALDRAPDAPGLEFYIDALADGWSLLRMATGFIASPEYAAEYGGTTDAEFLTRLYENAFGREPDAAGFAYQLDVLAHNPGIAGRAQMLATFIEAPETQVQLAGLADQGVPLYVG